MLPRLLHIASLFALATGAAAQEHPYIAAYDVRALDSAVRIEWTIQGGSTCDGQTVERSLDGVLFEEVHRISGICGDPTVPVSYGWSDEELPEFSTLHYRIALGIEGYSSVRSVVFDRLTTSLQRFFPVPVQDEATLLLNVPPATRTELLLCDAAGKVVLAATYQDGQRIDLSLHGLGRGSYTYRATTGSRTFTGRFVKQ